VDGCCKAKVMSLTAIIATGNGKTGQTAPIFIKHMSVSVVVNDTFRAKALRFVLEVLFQVVLSSASSQFVFLATGTQRSRFYHIRNEPIHIKLVTNTPCCSRRVTVQPASASLSLFICMKFTRVCMHVT
jgi:hypothetical protein